MLAAALLMGLLLREAAAGLTEQHSNGSQPLSSATTQQPVITTLGPVLTSSAAPHPVPTELGPLVSNGTSRTAEGPVTSWFQDGTTSPTLSIPLSPLTNLTSSVIETSRMSFGKNSFLTGFWVGFLAFGLKKLLLPFFIGAQIVKSVLVALFLPTILSGIGKLLGKGLTNVASQSGSSGGHDQVSEFEFKDPASLGGVGATGAGGGYDAEAQGSDSLGTWAAPSQAHATLAALNAGRNPSVSSSVYLPSASSSSLQSTKGTPTLQQMISDRYTPKLPSLPQKHTGSFYSKDPTQDYKVFQKIPSSSQLLTHYDPFYSPLLSRLDSVYQQLGTTSEGCRERLVCDMYSNPAKFAPFSNLVSAQLSRELNELRKPSSDNPEILRFFRYMKAAKDGQDGVRCDVVHNNCIAPTTLSDASPMVTTFNDINKLVQARALTIA